MRLLVPGAGPAAMTAAMLLLLAGCSSPVGSSQESPKPSPSATGQPSPSRTFQVTTPDGQVSVSLDGKLPPNWPGGFPTPPGATAAGSGSAGGSSSTRLVGVYSAPMSPEAAFAFYSANPRLTTSEQKTLGAGGTYAGTMRVTAPYTGSVTVAGRSDTTYIVIVLRAPGTSPSA